MIGLDDSTSTASCGCNGNNNTIGNSFNLISRRTNPNQHGISMDDKNTYFGSITAFHRGRLVDILNDAFQIVDEVLFDMCAAAPCSTTVAITTSAAGGTGARAESGVGGEAAGGTRKGAGAGAGQNQYQQ